MANKYYVVWVGRQTGVFTSWSDCRAQVDKFSNSRYKSFTSREEAEKQFGEGVGTQRNNTKLLKKQNKPKRIPASQEQLTNIQFDEDISTQINVPNLLKKQSKPKRVSVSQEQITNMAIDVKIFTDGACDPNPGKSGSGIAIYKENEIHQLWYGLYKSDGTNNTAELNGLYKALLISIGEMSQGLSVAIYCDSMYAINCVTQWAKSWSSKGWVKSGGDIKNLDIIKPMFAIYQQIEDKIIIHHVKGHAGIEGNELADRMSVIAINTQEHGFKLYSESTDVSTVLSLRRG